jgi:hypothetical protein
MIDLFDAAGEVHRFLIANQVPYVFIGGLAVQYWGEPRFTQDLGLTVAVPVEETEDFVRLVIGHFASRVKDPMAFVKRTRMLLVTASNGCPIDISLGLPGYEDQVIARAVEVEIEPAKSVRLCSAEDLIIHKAIAGRPIEGVVYRQGGQLDTTYISSWLNEFANLLADSDVLARFEEVWHRFQSHRASR